MLQTDLTTNDVAAALQLNKATVQRLLNRGRLKGYQIGRSWRVPQEALDNFRSHGRKDVSDPPRGSRLATPIDPKVNYAEWEALLLSKDGLASAPPIPLEAMRRENMYKDRY